MYFIHTYTYIEYIYISVRCPINYLYMEGQYIAPPHSYLRTFELAIHSVYNALPPGNFMPTLPSPVSSTLFAPFTAFLRTHSIYLITCVVNSSV